MVACGPYTSDDNLNFIYLKEFLKEVKNLNPEILIITGPFIPKYHSLVNNGILIVHGKLYSF